METPKGKQLKGKGKQKKKRQQTSPASYVDAVVQSSKKGRCDVKEPSDYDTADSGGEAKEPDDHGDT